MDGSYLRTALHLLGATEFLFAQYEKDIRLEANPAGVVGLSTAMHAEFERTTIWNEELKGFRDFMRDIKTQYQTCYGLGPSFPNDSSRRGNRRSRYGRRGFYRNQSMQEAQGFGAGNQQGFTSTVTRGRGRGGYGTSHRDLSAMRAQGVYYDFRAGSCGRGTTCRYLHTN